jgi:hypothetical protein
MELGKLNKEVKIYFYSAKNLLTSSFLFLNKKKRSKEKSSQQKTPALAGRRLVLWQAPALFAIMML